VISIAVCQLPALHGPKAVAICILRLLIHLIILQIKAPQYPISENNVMSITVFQLSASVANMGQRPWQYVSIPVIAGAVGYITNYVWVSMLFYPIEWTGPATSNIQHIIHTKLCSCGASRDSLIFDHSQIRMMVVPVNQTNAPYNL
jgi:hypothetical protein